jgi:ERF superfamily
MSTTTKENAPTVDLVNFLNAVSNVHADKVNSHLKSKYASLAEILETIKGTAAKHNIAVLQTATSAEGILRVSTSFVHNSGQVFDHGILSFKTEGMTFHQLGSAITYLRKMALQTCVGTHLENDSDDDGNKASATPYAPTSRPLTK